MEILGERRADFACDAFRQFKAGGLSSVLRCPGLARDWLGSVLLVCQTEGCSSIGRALVSKISGCGFKSLRPCHLGLGLKRAVSVDFKDGFLGCYRVARTSGLKG